MTQTELEKQLDAKNRKRRLIMGGICLLGVISTILLIKPLEAYPTEWMIYLIVFSIFCGVYGGIQLIIDFIACGYRTVTKGNQQITIYRGLLHQHVYVDGAEMAQLGPFTMQTVVHVWLDNKVRATISFTRHIWYMAHISYSDFSTSVEV